MTTLGLDFNKIRPMFRNGKLLQTQVDGINVILDTFNKAGDGNAKHLAYILATAKWETDQTMQPIREYGKGKGKPYGKPDKTGQIPYGRGFVQLTWDYNYAKADKLLKLDGALIHNYDIALRPDVASMILVVGCLEGWFTGKKLGDYNNFPSMRRVINGTDHATDIAHYADQFLAAVTNG